MQKRQKVFKPSPSIKLKKADIVKLFFNRLGYVAPQKTHRVIQHNRIRIERVASRKKTGETVCQSLCKTVLLNEINGRDWEGF